MVNSDGTAYLEYEVRNAVNEVVSSDTLYLMQISPDNSSSSTVLSSTTQNQALHPGRIVHGGTHRTFFLQIPTSAWASAIRWCDTLPRNEG